jgi:hypothetical protein
LVTKISCNGKDITNELSKLAAAGDVYARALVMIAAIGQGADSNDKNSGLLQTEPEIKFTWSRNDHGWPYGIA